MDAGWNLDNSYITLPEVFYTKLHPTPVKSPRLVVLNESLAEEMGLSVGALRTADGVAVFAGNQPAPGSIPLAQAYTGHQFGHFTMLGDGRAILLGEQIGPDGVRRDVQLKGSGPTPYSRGGDGRAALGPMLREYIISEAINSLRIPTTRSLAVVTTGENIVRESLLPGAILTRVAASHLRVGTFQYAATRGGKEALRALADYALRRHEPDVDEADPERYLYLLRGVIERQARLIAQWQLVGFIHGVMNTDNMTISGETIDYGPCAFMDTYEPNTVFSSIDVRGRYAYKNQPDIAGWNLARFAEALLPLWLDEDELNKPGNDGHVPAHVIQQLQEAVSAFADRFQDHWLAGMRAKLGLGNAQEDDAALANDLLSLMRTHKADYTNTFRSLTEGKPDQTPMHGTAEWANWVARWHARAENQPGGAKNIQERMRRANPAVIPRNHRVEEALSAAEQGDFSVMERLTAVLARPFNYDGGHDAYAEPALATNRPYITFCGT